MNRAPRILVISDRYLPEIGGSITWLHNVYMRHPAGTVWILTQDYPDAADFDGQHKNLSFTRRFLRRYSFLKPESLLIYLKLFLSALWIVLCRRIDIIHVGKNVPEGYVARLVSKFTGVPYVVYAHGEEITVCSKDPTLRKTLGPVYNDAAAVIANSRFTAGVLADAGIREDHVAQISPGYDPQTYNPGEADAELVAQHGLAGKTVLLSVGRLQLRKGHSYVLKALPEVLKTVPDLVYVIASDGEEWDELHRLVDELNLHEAVRFLGRVDEGDLPKLYRLCDVFIMANRELDNGDVEGFGIVFVEAGACGKPVIAGDSGGTSDPVRHGENGLRIDASRSENIRAAILELAADPERREAMGEAGKRIARQEYTWDIVTEKIQAVTARVLAGGSSDNRASVEADKETANV